MSSHGDHDAREQDSDDVTPTDAERSARERWAGIVEPGDSTAHALVSTLGASRALDLVSTGATAAEIAEALLATTGAGAGEITNLVDLVGTGLQRWEGRIGSANNDSARRAADRCGARFLIPGDAEWPVSIDDLGEHAPLGLWVRGQLDVLPGRSVAIVGSRNSTGYGEHVTVEIASGLAARGIGIVSGAAYGIDGHAHRAALASRGATVALLAGGVDRPYPRGHSELIERIAADGAILSEVPCGTTPTKWRFLQRNRLISALASATVVVEAGWRSGSLNTAAHAATLGRPLAAVPGPVTSPTSTGCHRLLRDHDAICVTTADEVAELAGVGGDAELLQPLRSATETRVLDAMSSRRPRTIDDIAARSGLDHASVRACLGELDVLGDARHTPNGWIMS
ncbi:DNA-processing protein DprA [Paramicrobacterium agarici]|uniref:DNA-processing protein DprA n=1 Tax=Paramicrobacterium agarici TaxID=630514 RepID=UPI00117375DF|nr:DNA-processing protein DprA [Microbacterium agarici]TQO21403.1 DNA protecting protein DprA [Microbacterium agarici]